MRMRNDVARQDSVTGVVSATPGAEENEAHEERKRLLSLGSLTEAVARAGERAAEALRMAREDGTRGTP